MGFLFTSKKKEKIVAIFDIGSGSIAGAIVRIPTDDNSLPMIIKSVRNEIRFHENFDFDSFMNDMLTTLNITANSLFYKNAGSPEEIFCVLASPWYLSETRTVKVSKDKTFTFNKDLAGELIKKEISTLIESYTNKYGKEEVPEIIEQNTMAVNLDGSLSNNPLGKKCKSLEMNMIISLSPKVCLNKIRETIAKTFHNENIKFSSFSFASYLAIRDKYIHADSYLLVDISGEITDVGVVTGGVLRSVLSFPFGKKTFFKYICTKLEIELRDAREIFNLYSEGDLLDPYKEKIIPLLKSIENSWGESFSQCINTLPNNIILPKDIFLTVDSDMRDWFTNILKTKEHISSSSYLHKFNVITIDGPEFLHMCDINEGSCDPFLMIEAISITRKINK